MNTYKVNGWLPDPDNDQYWPFDTLKGTLKASGKSVDLRPYSSAVHNQKKTGSCVANAVVKALEIKERFHAAEQGKPLAHTDISRMHLYYLCREMMNPSMTQQDSGTYISLCCEVLHRFGIAPESAWPFDVNKLYTPPNWKAMRLAYSHKMNLSAYYRITSRGDTRTEDVIKALRANHPVVYGTEIDAPHWFQYQKGQVLKPVSNSEGRHATCLVGWDEAKSVFIGENSWGSNWGDKGTYLMDPSVIESAASQDFWVIRGSWEPVIQP